MIACLFLLCFSIFSQDIAIQRPEPAKVMSILSDLNLTEKQKQEIEEELNVNLKKYDKIRKKYDKKYKEKQELEKEIEELRNTMIGLNKNVTTIIRSFLTEEQKIIFADIIKKQREKIKEQEEKKQEKKQEKIDDTKPIYEENKSPFDIYFP